MSHGFAVGDVPFPSPPLPPPPSPFKIICAKDGPISWTVYLACMECSHSPGIGTVAVPKVGLPFQPETGPCTVVLRTV